VTSFWSGLDGMTDFVSFLESRGIGQAVTAGLHLVTDHLQILTGAVMDIMQSIHEVRHVVGRETAPCPGKPQTTGHREDVGLS
jgi:hypothetical protein